MSAFFAIPAVCYWTTPLLVIFGMGGFQWGEREELRKGLWEGEKHGHWVSSENP